MLKALISLLFLAQFITAYIQTRVASSNSPTNLRMLQLQRCREWSRMSPQLLSSFTASRRSIRHFVSLPSSSSLSSSTSSTPSSSSVSEMHWAEGPLHIRMYTKGGCTLCDVVKAGFKDLKGTGEVAFTFEVCGVGLRSGMEVKSRRRYYYPS
jgi:hypothetical protein